MSSLNTSVVLKHLVFSLSIAFLFYIDRGMCVSVYKNLNALAVLSGDT